MKRTTLQVRLHPDEKKAFEKASYLSGASLSSWVRERLREVSHQELVNAGHQVPFLRERKDAK